MKIALLKFKDKYISETFTQVPGLVILIFGMVALYSTLSLINFRQNINQIYYDYDHEIVSLRAKLQAIQDGYDTFLDDKRSDDFSVMRSQLSEFNDLFKVIQSYDFSVLEGDIKLQEQYERHQYKIVQNIKKISSDISIREQMLNPQEQKKYEAFLQRDLQNTQAVLIAFHDAIRESYRKRMFSEELQRKEQWVYWSVIVIGFFRFYPGGSKCLSFKAVETFERRKERGFNCFIETFIGP